MYETHQFSNIDYVIIVLKRSLRMLCFHRCLSVHRGGFTWAGTPRQVHPRVGTPPRELPPWQVHPAGQVHAQRQVQPPLAGTPEGRYPTWAGTPPRQVYPPGRYPLGRYIPWAGTSPRQVHPPAGTPWAGTPPSRQIHPLNGPLLGYGQQAGGTHPTGMHSCY